MRFVHKVSDNWFSRTLASIPSLNRYISPLITTMGYHIRLIRNRNIYSEVDSTCRIQPTSPIEAYPRMEPNTRIWARQDLNINRIRRWVHMLISRTQLQLILFHIVVR